MRDGEVRRKKRSTQREVTNREKKKNEKEKVVRIFAFFDNLDKLF